MGYIVFMSSFLHFLSLSQMQCIYIEFALFDLRIKSNGSAETY